MSERTEHHEPLTDVIGVDDPSSPYDAHSLLVGDDTHWAFGTDFEDPLAGVDTTLPQGVDAGALAAYCLMLGDDALVFSQRLSEWCSRAPDLEEDVALANIALDLLGQARLLLARAAAADAGCVPSMPEGSPVPPEDALAFFREAGGFRNVHLAETPRGDFAEAVTRLVLFSTWRLALLERLRASRDPVLAAIAAKGVAEVTYHRDYAARWFVTLAQGTAESRRRIEAAVDRLWPLTSELFATHRVELEVHSSGAGVDPGDLLDDVTAVLDEVFGAAALARPALGPPAFTRSRGRDGVHTEAMGPLLAEMQVVARAHPLGVW